MADRKRYAVVGAGGRVITFLDGMADDCRDDAQLVGLCDISPTRMAWHNKRLHDKYGQEPVPTYAAADFEKMIKETKPDIVIVTCVDYLHHEYIVKAMELGCDAICEKPMTTDAEKAQIIFDAIKRTGKQLRVTFNLRYTPFSTKVRELIATGVIGTPKAVDFSWLLNTAHGADYFRRWHREKDKSGGLLVHKSTHHFDLVNWWVGSYPKTVYCMGDLKFYGRSNAEERGQTYNYDRYTADNADPSDPFALRLDKGIDGQSEVYERETLEGLYHNAEQDSGYVRDRNVFGDNITIEDTMAVTARYRSGVMLNYSLVAYSPWEGFQIAITGDKGRIELTDRHPTHLPGLTTAEEIARDEQLSKMELRVCPMFADDYVVDIPKAEGGHGGGDPVLVKALFSSNPPADPFNRAASHIDGAASCLMGIAANKSIATGMPVDVDSLLNLPT